jgi:acyl carrier protein
MAQANHALRLHLKNLILQACDIQDVSPQEIEDESPLFGPEGRMDLSSLDAVEIAMMLDHEFKVKLENASSARAPFRSIAALADHVVAQGDPVLLRPFLGPTS